MKSKLLLIFSFLTIFYGCSSSFKPEIVLPEVGKGDALSVAEQEIVKEALGDKNIPGALKLLSLVNFEQDGVKQRFRLATTAGKNGVFRLQVLPTTSLYVVQEIRITPDEVIVSSKNDEDTGLSLSPPTLRKIFGEVIQSRDLYSLIFGKVPASPKFLSFNGLNGDFIANNDKGVFESDTLDLAFRRDDPVTLSALILRDKFLNRPALHYGGSDYREINNRYFPTKSSFEFPRREIRIHFEHQKIAFSD